VESASIAPFFGKGWVDPLAEPGPGLAPAQALVEQDLVNAAALHRDALGLMQVGSQPIQGPSGKRQPQRLRFGQCGGDHGGSLFGRVGARPACAMPVLERFQSCHIEAVNTLAHGRAIKAQAGCNRRGALAEMGAPDNLGPLHTLGRSGVGVSQALDGRGLVSG
jgi:hypothetical protein